MDRNSRTYLLDILGEVGDIESTDGVQASERDIRIVLSSIYSDGLCKKRVLRRTDVLSFSGTFISVELADYVLSILEDRKLVGYLRLIEESGLEIFHVVEVIRARNSIVIFGAGHVGRSLSIFASILGYEVTLVDDRGESLQEEKLSTYGVRSVHSKFDVFFDSLSFYSNCAIVIVTRGHQFDEICLRKAICTQAGYIGMIGSKRRVLTIINNIKKDSLLKEELQKLESVYAPIGMAIGAKSPQEIGISILAQIIQVMNKP